jgi:hypothetical protein
MVMILRRAHQDAKNQASAAKTKASDEYKEMIKVHKRSSDSFHNQLEETCRKLNIIRECYHGGKYNGVMCIKIMNNSGTCQSNLAGHQIFGCLHNRFCGAAISATREIHYESISMAKPPKVSDGS